jgi:hypothetical protein
MEADPFEQEGTLNYGALSAIAPGLDLVRTHMPAMSLRLPALHHYLHTILASLVYPGTDMPLVQVHTKLRPLPIRYAASTKSSGRDTPYSSSGSENGSVLSLAFSRSPAFSPIPKATFKQFLMSFASPPSRTSSPFSSLPGSSADFGQPAFEETTDRGQGYVISCTFYTSDGTLIPLAVISALASSNGISLRTGCVCNPGGSAALRGQEIQDKMEELSKYGDDIELQGVGAHFYELGGTGVVRLSLGMVSNFEDVWRVAQWARSLLDETKRAKDIEKLGL